MLQYFYDDASGIIDISRRCRLYRTSVKSSAEEGEASISTLIIDDPDGDLIIDPFRQIYITETTAPTNEKVVYRGYVSDREIRRGPYRVGAGREWVVQLSDPNWLIGLRICVGSDANRSAENDLQRVQWLLTTTEANTFNGDDTYVNTSATTVAMDAADYRGQSVTSILDDCAQASGKNWWVVYFEAIGQYGLWYDFASEPVYDSPLSLSNDLADVDNSTVFAISQESTTLERSPSRLVSGVYLPYDGGNVYVQNPVVGSNTIFRDAAAPSVNVKSSAKATARANRYLADNATESDVIRTEVILPEAQVNDIMHGQRIEITTTHLPGYQSPTMTRVLNRTVTETSEPFLTVGLELSPMVTPISCPDDQSHFFPGTQPTGGFLYEISNVAMSPVDSGIISLQPMATLPYQPPALTPGNGTSSILIAGYVFGNEGTSAPACTSSEITIDRDTNAGDAIGTGFCPEVVVGHKLIPVASGSYSPDVVSSPSPFPDFGESRGWAAAAAVFLASGGTPTVVQTTSAGGVGSGTTLTLAAPPIEGNLLVAFVNSRQAPGNLDVPSGWTALAMSETPNTGDAGSRRYGRLMWKAVCADE